MEIAIVGAGIAGLTLAVALKQKGIDTTLFEASPEIKPVGAGITLASNALKVFENLGLKDKLIKQGQLIRQFKILDTKGKSLVSQSNYQDQMLAIHRARLHDFLLENIRETALFLNKKLIDLTPHSKNVLLKFEDGSQYEPHCVIGADGIHSLVRKTILPYADPRFAGYYCWRAVIKNPGLPITEATETWGTNGRFGIVPLTDNKIYWFACVNGKENNALLKSWKVSNLLHQFKNYHQTIITLLNNTSNTELLYNPIIDLKPLNRFAFGNVLLMGDAAHATTPNLGQGACQAIEDAFILTNLIETEKTFETAFKTFEKKRIKRVHWITKTSFKTGKLAQMENPALVCIRNFALRLVPSFIQKNQFKKLNEVNF